MGNEAPKKEPYMTFDPPQTLTQETPIEGLRFDFNAGLRVSVPEGNYRVRFVDRDAALTVYDAKASGVIATSTKRYFVNFRLEVYESPTEEEQKAAKAKEETTEEKLVFSHDYDAKGKNVLMKFAGAAMGDLWLGSLTPRPSAKSTAASFTPGWTRGISKSFGRAIRRFTSSRLTTRGRRIFTLLIMSVFSRPGTIGICSRRTGA